MASRVREGAPNRAVLVTGANGFVGRHLCAALAAAGHTLAAGVRAAESGAALPSGVAPRVLGDLAEGAAPPASALADVGCVVHLAARVHVMHDHGNAALAEYRRINVHGSCVLARAAARAGARRFVYVSSVKAMGEASASPLREADPRVPADAYGWSKAEAEDALREVADTEGIDLVVIRPPLIYGPGVRGNFRRLIQLAKVGARFPLPLSGGGRRSLVYVGNLVDALAATVEQPAAVGQTFFVRDGVDLTTGELLRRVGTVLGRPPRLFAVPPVVLRTAARVAGLGAEVDRLLGTLQVNDGHIRRTLGWTPPFDMDHALGTTVRALARGMA